MEELGILRNLSAEGQALLRARLIRRRFPRGETIIDKGQAVSGAYFVLQGRLRVYAYSPNGKEATLYLIDPGETCVLALNSLFNDLLYPAWVQTEEETTVGVIAGPVYRALFERERVVQDLTVRALSTVVFRLMSELEQIHACRLDQRLASFLLLHASADGVVRNTQQEIAAHLGTTREVVARLMAGFAVRGWVATRRGQISLLTPPALAALVRQSDESRG